MPPSDLEPLRSLKQFHLRNVITLLWTEYSLYLSTMSYSPHRCHQTCESIFSILLAPGKYMACCKDCCSPKEVAANGHSMSSAITFCPPCCSPPRPPFIPPAPGWRMSTAFGTRAELFWAPPDTIFYKDQYQHRNLPTFFPSSSEQSRVTQISLFQKSAEGQY